MDKDFVREEVAAFRQRWAFGRNEEDCFPIWYLNHRHGVAASDAAAQSADGNDGVRANYDYGLDAFHVLLDDIADPVLLLVQAKYRDDLSAISSALRDLERCLPRVAEALSVTPTAALKENRVLVSLRDRLRQLDENTRHKLKLRLEVLHLSDADEMIIRANTRKAFEDLREALANHDALQGWRHEVDIVGPAKMGGAVPPPVVPPQIWHELELEAVPLSVRLGERDVTMYSGIGRLADMVQLYNKRRSDLFAKNVRYFITNKHNEERGPAGKIKESLRAMCLKKQGDGAVEPELFAFHHNGITIFARDVERAPSGAIMRLRDPYVLNGCQTVRSAYDFRFDARLQTRIDDERWNRVKVPLRIITSQQEALIRQITISNNRQNQIAASALRANDEVQLEIERRLKGIGIFYERQKGAVDEFLRSNSVALAEYGHTNGRAVHIDELARCLAAAGGDFDLAHSPSHIFEYDAAYAKIFSPERVQSAQALVFLQNLHDVLPAILKRDLGIQQENPRAPRPSRVTYYVMCLLLRHLTKNQLQAWAVEFSEDLLGRERACRGAVTGMLGNHRSKIKSAINGVFMCLEDTSADTMRAAFRRASIDLGLRDNIDVFAMLGSLGEVEANTRNHGRR